MDDILLEPLKAYKEVYKNKFDENAKNHFTELVRKSALDVEKNRATVNDYKKESSVLASLKKKLSTQKMLRVMLIVLAVVGGIMLAIGIYQLALESNILSGAILTPIGVILAIVSVIVTVKVMTPKIRQLRNECNKQNKIAGDLKAAAWEQMACLNVLFESNVTKDLIESTIPLIKIDDNFDMRRYDYLRGKYGFGDNADINRSTIAILTGEILGNPFVVDRELVQSMGTETYTGSLVITWTTTYYDSDGKAHTEHHSETLYASVTKPKPFYSEQTRLIYGNEAAPDLTFSHTPSHAEKMSERELAGKVKSGARKIQRQQEKQLKQGGSSFIGMGNEEFDVLFGALDRNNEVQFRLLFTPLGQKNMLELMKDKDNFGDDFYFYKSNCLNFISSEHSQNWDLNTDHKRYHSYDVDDSFDKFMTFNSNYFKSLFFDLAPLLSIPLYQQHKPREYIYKDVYPRNYTNYEAEYAVNKLGQSAFENSLSNTKSILKTKFIEKDGKSDKLNVTAYSFMTEQRIDYIPRYGGDGKMHSVPVHWTEYIPVKRNSIVRLKQLDISDKEFNRKLGEDNFKAVLGKYCDNYCYSHGILCCQTCNDDLSFDNDINDVL